jgi:2-polyprenyl-3-methyl-5-hydroxy-6-metoxy-1,4-benzoquinol methylase
MDAQESLNQGEITMTTESPEAGSVTPEPLMQMMQGMHVTAILQAGVQLGIFDQIAAGNTDAATIAVKAGADERGTRILLDALAALRLLEKDGCYRLSPLADAFLVSSRPSYFGGMTDILDSELFWQAFSRFGEAVRRGGTILDQHAEVPGNQFWEMFARSSAGIAVPASHALAERLQPWAAHRNSLEVLDTACGSGLFGLTLAARYPQARVTLLDWPNVLTRTRRNVEKTGLDERVNYIAGDVFEVPLGGPYDLIVASHVFHHFTEQRCLDLLRRLAGALTPTGRLTIHDFTATGHRPADEPFPALFSALMLAWTQHGEAYPLATYQRLLAEAGFRAPEVSDSIGSPARFLITTIQGTGHSVEATSHSR